MTSTTDKRRAFRKLHESGCFIIPNPWDAGSARYLQSLGFKALAGTSSGFAWTQGRQDGGVPRERVLDHLATLAAATDLPLNADFENGFALDAAGVAESVKLAVATGICGLSIEDATGPMQAASTAGPLFELHTAVERIRAARRAIDESGGDVLLVGRAESFLVGLADIDMTIARLKAYADAGADCLYAPGIRSAAHIRAVVEAVHPKPVNLLVGGPAGLTFDQIAGLGVRRISVGGGLARAAWGGFMRAARALAETGNFDALADAPPHSVVNALFSAD